MDIIGDPEKLGKPVGADLAQNRGVMAVQNGDRVAVVNGGEMVTAVADADPFQQMMARLRDSGAVDVARLQAQETAVRARNALQQIPLSPARDELENLIDMVLDRDK